MQERLKKLFVKLLRDTADKVEIGNCELTSDEAMDIMGVISHEAMSKDAACSYLNIGKSKFDNLVREGKLPRGRSRRGFKELVFYKDELEERIKK